MFLFTRASFMTKTVQYQNELHKFLIWDTAGQERVSIMCWGSFYITINLFVVLNGLLIPTVFFERMWKNCPHVHASLLKPTIRKLNTAVSHNFW